MTAVRVRFRGSTPLPVDASALVPAVLAGRPAAELERLGLRVGNRELPLAELAEVTPGDLDTLVVEGGFASLDRLGRGMAGGRLAIEGDAGAYLGQDMAGGRIELSGSAGPCAAAGMAGGSIRVGAHAGAFLGAALPGDRHGMAGGAVVVGGDAGDRAGDRMRRGLIAVAGAVGGFAASRMIGGTVLALRGCGPHAGYAMRRGTLLLAKPPAELLPTFDLNGAHDLTWLRLLARELAELAPGLPFPGGRVERWTGCASARGKGEILVAC